MIHCPFQLTRFHLGLGRGGGGGTLPIVSQKANSGLKSRFGLSNKPGDVFLKVESLDSIMLKYVLVLCCPRSVLHFGSCFCNRPFKQGSFPPGFEVGHVCRGTARINTIGSFEAFGPETAGGVSDATSMWFHSRTHGDGGGLSVGLGSASRNPAIRELILNFHSVYSSVSRARCGKRLRCKSNQVKLDQLAVPPANFPVRSCARSESRTHRVAPEVWEPDGWSRWLSAHRVYSALHR